MLFRTIESIGSAILILSIPIDRFYQQMISYPTIWRIDPLSNATIARTILYDPALNTDLPSSGFSSSTFTTDSVLDVFLRPFRIGLGMMIPTQFARPTGNCMYDLFNTLAVEYTCRDHPSEILAFGGRDDFTSNWRSSIKVYESSVLSSPNAYEFCVELQDSKPQLMSSHEVTSDNAFGEMLATRAFPLANRTLANHTSLYSDDCLRDPIVHFLMTSAPGEFHGACSNNTLVIHECQLHWSI
jgi:hypothetical protein